MSPSPATKIPSSSRSLSPYSMVIANQQTAASTRGTLRSGEHPASSDTKTEVHRPSPVIPVDSDHECEPSDPMDLDDRSNARVQAHCETVEDEDVWEDVDEDEVSDANEPIQALTLANDTEVAESDISDSEDIVATRSSHNSEYSENQDYTARFYDEADLSQDDIDEHNARILLDGKGKNWQQSRCDANFEARKPKHFECISHFLTGQPCEKRQEYYSSRIAARFCISTFFGTNKNAWQQVPKNARVLICRKHYQSLWHEGRNVTSPVHENSNPRKQLKLIRIQIDKIEQWRPRCRFSFQLTEAMRERVDKYREYLEMMPQAEAAAKIDAERRPVEDDKAKKSRSKKQSKKSTSSRANEESEQAKSETPSKTMPPNPEELTPVLFAIDVERRFKADNVTADGLRATFDWLESKILDGTVERLPAVEALLQLRPQDLERIAANRVARQAAKARKLAGLKSDSDTLPKAKSPDADLELVTGPPAVASGGSSTNPLAAAFTPINVADPAPQTETTDPLVLLQRKLSEIRAVVAEAGIDMSDFDLSLPDNTTLPDAAPRRPRILLKHSGNGKGKAPVRYDSGVDAEKSRSQEKRSRDEPSERETRPAKKRKDESRAENDKGGNQSSNRDGIDEGVKNIKIEDDA